MFRSVLRSVAVGVFVSAALAQDPKSAAEALQGQPDPAVRVPAFPNATCPIMGKPASTRLFAETEKGRIYICCKSCVKDILADVDTAYRTAYPTDQKVGNKTCPITGDEINEQSPTIVIQGFEISVHSSDCIAKVRENSQIVLAKLNDPKLVDLENRTCPVTGEATTKNTFVVIEDTIVRLSSPNLVEEIAKDPAKVLAKAKGIRAAEEKQRQSSKP